MKTALITGITGQDGSYLADLLLEKDYKVVGMKRRSSTNNEWRIAHLKDHKNFELVEGDIIDSGSVFSLLQKYKPDECYNLAAQSHVGTSFEQPSFTFQVNAIGVLNLLEGIRQASPKTRFYQASTSEMFGSNYSIEHDSAGTFGQIMISNPCGLYQDEKTPFAPNSPYAAAKAAAHDLVNIYKKSYGIHASAGILFNHESPRRGENFVTQKIIKWLKDFTAWKTLYKGEDILFQYNDVWDNIQAWSIQGPLATDQTQLSSFTKLRLGNLDACRDWGHAKDYVRAMWLMLQQEKPDNYVIATGKTHSVKEFLNMAFAEMGIKDQHSHFVIDPKFYRPCEVELLCGNASKARQVLGWEPEYDLLGLIQDMLGAI